MKRISFLEAWCRESLIESGHSLDGFQIFTATGEFRTRTINTRSMLVPRRIWKSIEHLPKTKTKTYGFKGQIYDNRQWVLEYPGVSESTRGSIIEHRSSGFDLDYYVDMASSKFTLCPIGVESYSHRLLEAIACHSIPILGSRDIDLLTGNWFAYYRHGNIGSYREDWIEHNYKEFLRRHTV